MTIIYEDEYGNYLFDSNAGYIPNNGDMVLIGSEEYYVKSRIFYPEEDSVRIIVADSIRKSSVAESGDIGRQKEMKNAIVALTDRVNLTEKKQRALTDQLSTVRHGINNRIKQDKKDQQND
jgi:hypothetical protein